MKQEHEFPQDITKQLSKFLGPWRALGKVPCKVVKTGKGHH